MTLTKANIVEVVAEHIGFTNKRSFEIVETLLEIIKGSLESGEDVLISGFGKLWCKRKERTFGEKSCNWRGYDADTKKSSYF